jgi:hypothetical protein
MFVQSTFISYMHCTGFNVANVEYSHPRPIAAFTQLNYYAVAFLIVAGHRKPSKY